jgi:2-methylisocitrate lyase-like PEP mutase family enzyme
MATQGQKLRALLHSGEHFIAAEAYSALTGRIVERVGFKAAYLGGHACSAFHYAVPDNGVFSQVEQIEQASRIAGAMSIPLIADADTLGETVADAFHFARRYARAGIGGIHVEDEANPKHSIHVGALVPIIEMQARLEAARKGAGDSGLVIIARCDELYPKARGGGGDASVEEAIKRGRAYMEAGADALVFPFATPETMAELQKGIPGAPMTVLGMPIEGTACTLFTGFGWMGAAQLHIKRCQQLLETGRCDMDPVLEGKDQLIEQDVFDEIIAGWAKKTGRPLR